VEEPLDWLMLFVMAKEKVMMVKLLAARRLYPQYMTIGLFSLCQLCLGPCVLGPELEGRIPVQHRYVEKARSFLIVVTGR
jgi:hypothetical protein